MITVRNRTLTTNIFHNVGFMKTRQNRSNNDKLKNLRNIILHQDFEENLYAARGIDPAGATVTAAVKEEIKNEVK
jgi:hypothetical protein